MKDRPRFHIRRLKDGYWTAKAEAQRYGRQLSAMPLGPVLTVSRADVDYLNRVRPRFAGMLAARPAEENEQ